MVDPQQMARAIQTWTDAELAADSPAQGMTWADAMQLITATCEGVILGQSLPDYDAEPIREALNILAKGAAK